MIRIIISVIFIITSTVGSAQAIEVSGDVWGQWGPGDNPYLVTGDLRVPPESSLVILPGCRIEFQDNYKFVVDSLAFFRAEGVEGDSIIFTNLDTLEGWNGIRFYWADSSCALAYCRLEWGRARDAHPYGDLANGGAVHCVGGGLAIENCLFQFNRAWEAYGGAVYARFSRLEVRNSVLVHNRCGSGGAAVYATDSYVLIEGCDISRDTTFYILGGERGGGAIGCWYSDVIIRDNTIAGNLCGLSGGGVLVAYSNAIITSNIIAHNECWYHGGGIVASAVALIASNLIFGNIAQYGTAGAGGGVACGDSVTLVNNTIALNHSDYFGGGISTVSNSMWNNIVWGNTANTGSQIYSGGQPLDASYNDVQGGWPGAGNIDADPLFRDAANGDFHLMALACGNPQDSPCIDVGDPNVNDDSLACDFGLGTIRSDMGAYGGGSVNPDAIDESPAIPNGFFLLQNYPNPFNSSTTISFSIIKTERVTLEIFDIRGRKVKTLNCGLMRAGYHSIIWDGANSEGAQVASGVYFVRMTAAGRQFTRNAVMLK